MSQPPDKHLPRTTLHPASSEERTWRAIPVVKRHGLDKLDDVAQTPSNMQTVQDLRYTLEQSGAFHVPGGYKDSRAEFRLTEEQRLQKWVGLSVPRKIRADAPRVLSEERAATASLCSSACRRRVWTLHPGATRSPDGCGGVLQEVAAASGKRADLAEAADGAEAAEDG